MRTVVQCGRGARIRRVTVEERQGHIRRPAICGHPLARCHHGGAWRLRLLDTVQWATLTARDYDGIWLSSQAARSVHARAGNRLALRAGGRVRVAGVFQYPDDGRSTSYDYVALSQVPAAADDFDQCLVKAWPVPDAMQSLLQSDGILVVIGRLAATYDQPAQQHTRHAARCRQDIPGEAKRARSRCDVRLRVVRRICRGACPAARTGVSHALRGAENRALAANAA